MASRQPLRVHSMNTARATGWARDDDRDGDDPDFSEFQAICLGIDEFKANTLRPHSLVLAAAPNHLRARTHAYACSKGVKLFTRSAGKGPGRHVIVYREEGAGGVGSGGGGGGDGGDGSIGGVGGSVRGGGGGWGRGSKRSATGLLSRARSMVSLSWRSAGAVAVCAVVLGCLSTLIAAWSSGSLALLSQNTTAMAEKLYSWDKLDWVLIYFGLSVAKTVFQALTSGPIYRFFLADYVQRYMKKQAAERQWRKCPFEDDVRWSACLQCVLGFVWLLHA